MMTVKPITAEVIEAVPVGEANALGAADIWKRMDCWAKTTVRQKLELLVGAGQVKQGEREIASGFMRVYWRNAA